MLHCKNCCRNNYSRLLTRHYRLKHSTDCNLCFAKPYIGTNKPVHRFGILHIGFCFLNGFHLVGGFRVFESFFHFTLPYGIGFKSNALCGCTFCIKMQQVFCDIFNSFFSTGFCYIPVVAAHSGKLRCRCTCAPVSDKKVNLFGRHVQFVAVCVFYSQIIFKLSVYLLFGQPLIQPHTVNLVNDIFALFDVVYGFDIFGAFFMVCLLFGCNILGFFVKKFSVR